MNLASANPMLIISETRQIIQARCISVLPIPTPTNPLVATWLLTLVLIISGSPYHFPGVRLARFCQLFPVTGDDSGRYQPGIQHFYWEGQSHERGSPSGLVRGIDTVGH